ARAVSTAAQYDQRAAGRRIERLGEGHERLGAVRIGRDDAGLSVRDERDVVSLAHPASQLRRATKPRVVAGYAALDRRAHDAQRVDFVPAGDRDARVGVGGPAAGAHVHGDHRTAGAAPRRRETARLDRVARGKAGVALRRVYAPAPDHLGPLTELSQR